MRLALANSLNAYRVPVPTPEHFEASGRTSFGAPLNAAGDAIFDYFKLQNNSMDGHAFYDARGWARVTVDVGEVASGDAATVERTELDTLTRLEPQIGGNPSLSMSFGLWVPVDQHTPVASASVIVAQMKITSADATQIIFHTSGALRVRAYNGSIYAQTQIIPADQLRGVWHRIDMLAVHSKTSAGQMEIWVDGVLKYSRYDGSNIGGTPADTEKVYLKFGTYRPGADTDPTRGLASMWFKDLVVDTLWAGP